MNRELIHLVCTGMTTHSPFSPLSTRRAVLAASASVTTGLALAACGGGDNDATDTDPGAGPETTGPESTGPGAGSSAPEGEQPGGGEPLAALSEVPVGEATAVTTPDGQEAVLFRPDEATVAGFSAICTHQGCPVQPEGAELRCPCHQSVFDAATGEVLGGPADEPLPALSVRVQDGQVVVTE